MPKRRAFGSSNNDFKKSRDISDTDDVVIEVVRNAAEMEDDSCDEPLQQLSPSERMSPSGNKLLLSTGQATNSISVNSFSSSLDAALRRAAVMERRAACEEREEEAIRAAAAVLKAEEDADAAATEAETEAEAIMAAQEHETARLVGGGSGRRRLSELDVAEMMADGHLAEPRRMHMMEEQEDHNYRSGRHRRRHYMSDRHNSMDFTPPLDIMPCPIYDVDVQLRKYVRADGRQLSHTPVALAARQNRQKRKEYVKKMEIAYANMQFETQYLRERTSRLQQELKWYKERWAEHATKCPLLHTSCRQTTAFKTSTSGGIVDVSSAGANRDSLSNQLSSVK